MHPAAQMLLEQAPPTWAQTSDARAVKWVGTPVELLVTN